MSWDVSLLRFARRYDTLEEVEEDAEMLTPSSSFSAETSRPPTSACMFGLLTP